MPGNTTQQPGTQVPATGLHQPPQQPQEQNTEAKLVQFLQHLEQEIHALGQRLDAIEGKETGEQTTGKPTEAAKGPPQAPQQPQGGAGGLTGAFQQELLMARIQELEARTAHLQGRPQ